MPRRKKQMYSFDYAATSPKTCKSVNELFDQFEKIFGPQKDWNTKSRKRHYVYSRFSMMNILRNYFHLTLNETALKVGGRDHSTVINGLRKVEECLKDPRVNKELHFYVTNTVKYCCMEIERDVHKRKVQIMEQVEILRKELKSIIVRNKQNSQRINY
jgi:hypothetical protein